DLLALEHQSCPDIHIARRRGRPPGLRLGRPAPAWGLGGPAPAVLLRGPAGPLLLGHALGAERRTRPMCSICRPHLPRSRLRFSYSVGSSTTSTLPLYVTRCAGSTWRTASSSRPKLKDALGNLACRKKYATPCAAALTLPARRWGATICPRASSRVERFTTTPKTSCRHVRRLRRSRRGPAPRWSTSCSKRCRSAAKRARPRRVTVTCIAFTSHWKHC